MLKSLKKKEKWIVIIIAVIFLTVFSVTPPCVGHAALQTCSLCSGDVPPLTLLVNAGASTAEHFLVLIAEQFSWSTHYPAVPMNKRWGSFSLAWVGSFGLSLCQQLEYTSGAHKIVLPSQASPGSCSLNFSCGTCQGEWGGCGSVCLSCVKVTKAGVEQLPCLIQQGYAAHEGFRTAAGTRLYSIV